MMNAARGLIAAFMLAVAPGAPAGAGPAVGDGDPVGQIESGRDPQHLWPLAEAGEAWAQYNLGLIYHRGEGVGQSDVQAAYWYREAARNGDMDLRMRAGLRLVELAMAGVAAEGERRFALVIGNSAYRNAAPLDNASRDARDMAALLERLGFDVTLTGDLDRRSAIDTLFEFASRAEGADIAAIYYSGHGLAAGGENYLVPVDARGSAGRGIRPQTVPLGAVLRAVENAGRLGLVMLDASRGNPFADDASGTGEGQPAGGGLAAVEPEAGNVLVAYAAGSGMVSVDGEGGNSPYTAALIEHLDDRDIAIGEAFGRVRDTVMRLTQGRQQPITSGAALAGNGAGVVLAPGREETR